MLGSMQTCGVGTQGRKGEAAGSTDPGIKPKLNKYKHLVVGLDSHSVAVLCIYYVPNLVLPPPQNGGEWQRGELLPPTSPPPSPPLTRLLELGLVHLCICFHQLLDEGSMKTVRVFIDLITK
ncbi:hypothetical protein STEG23_002062, partial [Scotinomys teguina]